MSAPAVGVFLPTMVEQGHSMPDIIDAARRAEEYGFESAWAVDQLIAGTGTPIIDSTVALSAAAGATSHLLVGYGVMILPLRPVVWAAKQVASLQQLSGNRLLLGVGAGGDRHNLSWDAAGVPRHQRGRRTDAALRALPDLVAGKTVSADGVEVTLAPAATMPAVIVGGTADAALARAVSYGDGWFALPLPPSQIAPVIRRLEAFAVNAGRTPLTVTASMAAAISGDPELPDRDGLLRQLSNPDGLYGMPPEAAADILLTGGPGAIADRIEALGALEAERVVVTLVGGNWYRQAELLANAMALLG